jgi:hypothetical protein
MSELLSAAAKALNAPEVLVQRSAEARAKASGASVDEILAAWAGGEAAPSPGTQTEVPSTQTEQPEAPEPEVQGPEPEPEPSPPPSVISPQPEQPAAAAVAAMAPVPTEVTSVEALRYPVVVSVPTAGITERTVSRLPRWLAATFFILPVFGLLYLAGAATADCGEGALLRVDRVTGALVNCDGSQFEGRGTPGSQVNFLALGETIFMGPPGNCAGCHGAQGQGTAAGPTLTAVASTFSACADHMEWVGLGTLGFIGAGRTTYGDAGKPAGGFGANMPGFANQMSDEQLASVAAFERVRFGGASPDESGVDCGLVEAEEPEEGDAVSPDEATDEEESPAPEEGEGQEEDTTTTTPP